MSEDVTVKAPSTIEDLKPAMALTGKVKRIELYGAFVDVGVGKDALLHISQLGKKVRNVEDVIKVDEELTVYVLKVDKGAGRIALSLTKPPEISIDQISVGDKISGKIIRIEKFGVFVDIGAERPGMVHVSELTDGYVKSPEDVVKVSQDVEVRVIKIDKRKRQIDLSMKPEAEVYEAAPEEEEEELPTAMALAFRRAMEGQDDAVEEEAPASRKRSKRDRDSTQDEIVARTLRYQDN